MKELDIESAFRFKAQLNIVVNPDLQTSGSTRPYPSRRRNLYCHFEICKAQDVSCYVIRFPSKDDNYSLVCATGARRHRVFTSQSPS